MPRPAPSRARNPSAPAIEVDDADVGAGARRDTQPLGHVGGPLGPIDDPVDRRAPRALSDRSDAQRLQRVDQRSGAADERRRPAGRRISIPTSRWISVSATPNSSMSPASSPGSSAVSSSRDTRRLGVARLAQLTEEALLRIPGEPLDAERQREHAPPPLRHRVTGDQRADPAPVAHAGLDDEPRGRKRPAADAGARPPPARLGQLFRPGGDARQLGQPARDRQTELGARPEPHVRRDRLVARSPRRPR